MAGGGIETLWGCVGGGASRVRGKEKKKAQHAVTQLSGLGICELIRSEEREAAGGDGNTPCSQKPTFSEDPAAATSPSDRDLFIQKDSAVFAFSSPPNLSPLLFFPLPSFRRSVCRPSPPASLLSLILFLFCCRCWFVCWSVESLSLGSAAPSGEMIRLAQMQLSALQKQHNGEPLSFKHTHKKKRGSVEKKKNKIPSRC